MSIKHLNGFTYVLLSPSTAQAPEAYRIADHYRRRGSRVLMGGPHVTVCPEEAARHADTVFVGESEELFPLFFREEQQGTKNLPGPPVSTFGILSCSPIRSGREISL